MLEGLSRVSTGLGDLDTLVDGLIPGDNIVWVADSPEFLTAVEDAYLRHAVAEGRSCSYVTAAMSPVTLRKRLGGQVAIVDARPGRPLDHPIALERAMVERARNSSVGCTVVDGLGVLASRWGPKKAGAFFNRTCPQLFYLGALAYWRAPRGALGSSFLEDVRHVTQCVIEVVGDRLRVVKAEGRPAGLEGQLVRFHFADGVMQVGAERALGRLARGLQELRKARKLSQTALASLAGVTPSAISQAETGRRGLSLDTLLVIADKLRVSLDDLLVSAPSPGYAVVRRDRLGTAAPVTTLLDDPSTGLRALLIRLGPGQSGMPPWRHKGAELVLVSAGLIQLRIGGDAPLMRSGDAALATSAPIDGWRNLLPDPASLFWILRDP